MKISGIIKTSLIDYPGNIVTSIFTQGCNFKCPYCHNPDLIPVNSKNKEYMNLNYFWDFLKKRKKFLDGIVITGGEPTLQSDLVEFIEKIKSKNFKVKLDTNGAKPEIVRELINNELINYIAMDIKSSLPKYNNYSNDNEIGNKIIDTVNFIKNSNIDYEFRTTVAPTLHDKQDIEDIGQLISGADKFTIQNFRSERTYNKKFENKLPITDYKLKSFKKILKKHVENIEIKN